MPSGDRPFLALDKTSGQPAGPYSDKLRQRIAELAYQLYECRGRQNGHDFDDWLEAERLILRC
jgi:hypothetical protein